VTFIGAAAGYRFNVHMSLSYFVNLLPKRPRYAVEVLVQLLLASVAVFMTVWGYRLVVATWYNTIAEFPVLSVGVTYLPIPVGAACMLLFIIERMWLGPPQDPAAHVHEPEPFD
jgi:TRAP-type C4-dicarboxylate transport system permease small subunit